MCIFLKGGFPTMVSSVLVPKYQLHIFGRVLLLKGGSTEGYVVMESILRKEGRMLG